MATYKVPQDVEADDKLLGPFSFRQVIYLAVAVAGGVVAWGLSNIFIVLAIIPVPIIIVFLILALPLRKDQPMEIYAAAILSYMIKPRKRLWYADGIVSLIEVSQPTIEEFRGKGLTEAEAADRLNYLSQLVDTQGWAVRGLSNAPTTQSNLADDVFYDTQSTEDMLDENSQSNLQLSQRLAQADTNRRDALMAQFKSSASQPQPAVQPVGSSAKPITTAAEIPASAPNNTPDQLAATAQSTAKMTDQPESPTTPSTAPDLYNQFENISQPATTQTAAPTPAATTDSQVDPKLVYSPYPDTMRQSMIHPISDQPPAEATPEPTAQTEPPTEPDSPGKTTPHPDIINLASNSDLSVETIAREAKRINKKYDDDEIVLQLH